MSENLALVVFLEQILVIHDRVDVEEREFIGEKVLRLLTGVLLIHFGSVAVERLNQVAVLGLGLTHLSVHPLAVLGDIFSVHLPHLSELFLLRLVVFSHPSQLFYRDALLHEFLDDGTLRHTLFALCHYKTDNLVVRHTARLGKRKTPGAKKYQ